MYAGQVVEYGSIEELYDTPLHPYTQGLLQSIPHPEKMMDELAGIPGFLPNLLNPPVGCRFQDRCEKVMAVCKTSSPVGATVSGSHNVACHLIDHGDGDA
jgi:oligopeptide/dipeptide ABC transporter ATP-binding protein